MNKSAQALAKFKSLATESNTCNENLILVGFKTGIGNWSVYYLNLSYSKNQGITKKLNPIATIIMASKVFLVYRLVLLKLYKITSPILKDVYILENSFYFRLAIHPIHDNNR